jgi:hypothetical protein
MHMMELRTQCNGMLCSLLGHLMRSEYMSTRHSLLALQGQQQLQGMPHQRSSSFSGASGGLPPHPPDFSSTRSHSAGM